MPVDSSVARRRRPRFAFRATLFAAALAAGVACGGTAESSVAYDGPYADRVRKLIPQLEQATGMQFTSPPRLEMRDRDEVRSFLEREFERSPESRDLDLEAAAYRRLGLLPDTLDLRKLFLDLLTEQIAGYYDPKAKTLYVVEGQSDEIVGVTIAHELVHALQDQHLNLDSIQSAELPNDEGMAVQAVIEGQAIFEQFSSMLGGANFAARLPGGWDMVRRQVRDNSANMPRFAAAPFLIQETLIFPYLSGAEFVREWKRLRPGENPLSRLPASTEQVLHPTLFLGDTVDAPTFVTLPAPRRGAAAYANTLGEFETRLFLYEHLQDQPTAYRGAAGWDGDQYQVVRFPTGEGLAWVSVWDGPVDAAEFYQQLDRTIIARFAPETYRKLGENGRIYRNVKGRDVRIEAVEVQGRPGVLYVDVPAGTETDLVDVARVTLTGN